MLDTGARRAPPLRPGALDANNNGSLPLGAFDTKRADPLSSGAAAPLLPFDTRRNGAVDSQTPRLGTSDTNNISSLPPGAFATKRADPLPSGAIAPLAPFDTVRNGALDYQAPRLGTSGFNNGASLPPGYATNRADPLTSGASAPPVGTMRDQSVYAQQVGASGYGAAAGSLPAGYSTSQADVGLQPKALPQSSPSRDFIAEQEQIDQAERQQRRLGADGISLEGSPKITKLTLGPALEKQFGKKDMNEILQMKKRARAPVTLHVYEVGHSEAVGRINKFAQDFLHEGGVFHGAVEVYDKEWSFGGTDDDGPGVFCCEPTRCSMHTYRESVYLGDCKKSASEVEQIVRSMLPDWAGKTYDLLHKNCCSFSNAFAQKLGVGEIPEWVHHLAHLGSKLDEETKAALCTLHKVEDVIAKDAHAALNLLGQRKDGQKETHRACRCCWYEF